MGANVHLPFPPGVARAHITSAPLFRVGILRINAARAHFVFINKTACQLRLRLDAEQLIILTTISPIQSHKQPQKAMQKYCSTLKFMWKEFDTKLIDNFRKMLEND